MSDKNPEFGTYAYHQPNYEGFKALGKLDDYIYQALVHMGNASHHMSWANTVLADQTDVSRELINEMKGITSQIHAFQERLREIQTVSAIKEESDKPDPQQELYDLINQMPEQGRFAALGVIQRMRNEVIIVDQALEELKCLFIKHGVVVEEGSNANE